jgi:hypothetical protein
MMYELKYFQIRDGSADIPTVTVTLVDRDGRELIDAGTSGVGPIDAFWKAVRRLVELPDEMVPEFEDINVLDKGEEARARVSISVSVNGMKYRSASVNQNITKAGIFASMYVINQFLNAQAARAKEATV